MSAAVRAGEGAGGDGAGEAMRAAAWQLLWLGVDPAERQVAALVGDMLAATGPVKAEALLALLPEQARTKPPKLVANTYAGAPPPQYKSQEY